MRRAAALAVLALAACGGGAPIEDVPLRVTTSGEEVELGRAFPLTVVRVWDGGGAADAWDEAALAPLLVRLEAERRRSRGGRVEETRRYRAYAFEPGVVTLAGLPAPLEIRVRPQLDPEAPGPVEWPGPALDEPAAWLPPALAAIVVLLALVLLLVARGRSPPDVAEPPPPPAPPPQDDALRRLRALREARPGDAAAVLDFHVETAGLLRDYAGARYALRTREMTSEEIAAALPPPPGPRLLALLRACDLVKFARRMPAAPELTELLDSAERFVQETSA